MSIYVITTGQSARLSMRSIQLLVVLIALVSCLLARVEAATTGTATGTATGIATGIPGFPKMKKGAIKKMYEKRAEALKRARAKK